MQITIEGIAELREALLHLPAALRDEARFYVKAHADVAEQAVAAVYPEGSGRLRGLRNSLYTRDSFGAAGIRVTLLSRSPIAWIYENGTEFRHKAIGASTGRMPAAHAFIPIVIRERRALVADLIALVERAGLVVHGG